jgi:hypothetical protein
VDVVGSDAGQGIEQPRLEHRVHAVVGDERAIRGGGERRRDRVRLAALPQVVDADPLAAQPRGGVPAERAENRGGDTQPRRGHGGDHRAAADGRVEGVGLHFLAERRQAVEADEDQVLEGVAGGEQSRSGHAEL